MADEATVSTDGKMIWVEPEVRSLDVADTLVFPRRGADGQVRFIDCTRS